MFHNNFMLRRRVLVLLAQLRLTDESIGSVCGESLTRLGGKAVAVNRDMWGSFEAKGMLSLEFTEFFDCTVAGLS